jgi:hypothetical protein
LSSHFFLPSFFPNHHSITVVHLADDPDSSGVHVDGPSFRAIACAVLLGDHAILALGEVDLPPFYDIPPLVVVDPPPLCSILLLAGEYLLAVVQFLQFLEFVVVVSVLTPQGTTPCFIWQNWNLKGNLTFVKENSQNCALGM